MTIILGIDPGSRVTGYGVIRQTGRQLEYLGSGAIRTQVDDLPTRLKRIYAGVSEIITQFQPDMFAIEQVFMAKNADSALKLGQARGTAIVAAVNHDLPVFEYAARLIKQTVVGIGSADKVQVQEMVTRILKLSDKPQADAADALAIAITHAHSIQHSFHVADAAGQNETQEKLTALLRTRYSRGRFRLKIYLDIYPVLFYATHNFLQITRIAMIGHLTGILMEKQPPEILLDVQGVGYELLLPMTSFYHLPEVGKQTSLFTHLVVREDAHLLFGFAQKTDRTLFRELIKTNGVGPKLALAILSAMSVDEFAYAIEREELSKLVKIPGVGKKTAERLLVELKGKFNGVKNNDFFMQADHLPSFSMEAVATTEPSNEAVAALIALGYKPVDAEKMVKKVSKPELSSEQLIREALKAAL